MVSRRSTIGMGWSSAISLQWNYNLHNQVFTTFTSQAHVCPMRGKKLDHEAAGTDLPEVPEVISLCKERNC